MKAIELKYTLESSFPHERSLIDALPASALQRIVDFIDPIDRCALRSTCRTVLDALDSSDTLSMDQLNYHQAKCQFERHSRQGFQNLHHVRVNVASWHAHDRQDLTRRILAARWTRMITLHIISHETLIPWYSRLGRSLFTLWSLNGFVSVARVSESSAKPAPKLKSLIIDCYMGLPHAHRVDITGIEIPDILFTGGCRLRRLIARGFPWQERLFHRFRDLQSLTFMDGSAIYGHQIDELLDCIPNLSILRLECEFFRDISQLNHQ